MVHSPTKIETTAGVTFSAVNDCLSILGVEFLTLSGGVHLIEPL